MKLSMKEVLKKHAADIEVTKNNILRGIIKDSNGNILPNGTIPMSDGSVFKVEIIPLTPPDEASMPKLEGPKVK